MSCWLSYVFDDSLMCFRLQNRLFVLFCARASSLFIHEGCICFSWPLCWYDCLEISKLFLELVRPNEFLSHGLLNISRVIKIILKWDFFCREHTLRSDLKGPWSRQTCFAHKTQQLQDWQSSAWMEVKQWRRSALNNISLSPQQLQQTSSQMDLRQHL